MAFSEWEIDDDIWEREGENGEIQESLPERRSNEGEEASGGDLLI